MVIISTKSWVVLTKTTRHGVLAGVHRTIHLSRACLPSISLSLFTLSLLVSLSLPISHSPQAVSLRPPPPLLLPAGHHCWYSISLCLSLTISLSLSLFGQLPPPLARWCRYRHHCRHSSNLNFQHLQIQVTLVIFCWLILLHYIIKCYLAILFLHVHDNVKCIHAWCLKHCCIVVLDLSIIWMHNFKGRKTIEMYYIAKISMHCVGRICI